MLWGGGGGGGGLSDLEQTSSFAVLYTTGRQESRHIVWRVYTRHELLQVLAEACVQGVDVDSASKCIQPIFMVLVAHMPLPPPEEGEAPKLQFSVV